MKTRSFVSLVVAVLLGLVLTSCGGSDSDVDTSVQQPSAVATAIDEGAVVIDVRTPAEFAAGHLADALNIDVSASDFESRIEELDKEASYVLYCQSGNRSTQAAEKMADLGFTDLTNGGGFAALASAGIPTS